jgi:hypothetical protein
MDEIEAGFASDGVFESSLTDIEIFAESACEGQNMCFRHIANNVHNHSGTSCSMKGIGDTTSNEMLYAEFAEDLNYRAQCIDQVVWLCQDEAPIAWLRMASARGFP